MSQDWSALHLRVARREGLSAEESTFYQQGLADRHAEETIHFDAALLKSIRHNIHRLESERVTLETKRQSLQCKIAQFESSLSSSERVLWGLD